MTGEKVSEGNSHGMIGTDNMILANQFFILGLLFYLVLTSAHLDLEPKRAANVLLLVWAGGTAMLCSRPLGRALETLVDLWGGRSA